MEYDNVKRPPLGHINFLLLYCLNFIHNKTVVIHKASVIAIFKFP